jgi:hypothetical protein
VKKEERISVLTIVLFVLGPLPQFVKLNACSGIPWTLTWSWIYMLCYLSTAVAIIVGAKAKEREEETTGTALTKETKDFLKMATRRIYLLAHLTHAIFSIWLAGTSYATHSMHIISTLCFIGLIVVRTAVSIVSTTVTIGTSQVKQANLLRRLGGVVLIVLGASFVGGSTFFLFGTSIPMSLLKHTIEEISKASLSSSIILWALHIIMLPGLMLGVLGKLSMWMGPSLEVSIRDSHERELSAGASHQKDNPKKKEEQADAAQFHLFFALAMLVLALAYYWQRYNPSDTMKPSWVDVFG